MLATWNTASALDQMLDDVMGDMVGAATSTRTFEPAIDVRVTATDVVFVCDVPGLKLEDLEVTLENRVLTIRGNRKFENAENAQVLLGRAYGAFRRSFAIPENLDDANLAAHLADGVLTISIPKTPRAAARKIVIGSTGELKAGEKK